MFFLFDTEINWILILSIRFLFVFRKHTFLNVIPFIFFLI